MRARARILSIVAKNPHAVALSRLGASKGGKARARALSPARRRALALVAASSGLVVIESRRRRDVLGIVRRLVADNRDLIRRLADL